MLIPTAIEQINNVVSVLYSNTLQSDTAVFDTGANGIPGTFSHLKIEAYLRTTEATAFSAALLRFNGDSGTNYDRCTMRNDNTTLSGTTSLAQGSTLIRCAGASVDANFFSPIGVWIPNYAAGAGFNKSHNAVTSVMSTDATECSILIIGAMWRSAASINQISLTANSGSFLTGSRVTIYGLR